MPAASDWKVPSAVQPKARDYGYDLDRALAAVVGVRSVIPPDAFSAETLTAGLNPQNSVLSR